MQTIKEIISNFNCVLCTQLAIAIVYSRFIAKLILIDSGCRKRS